MNPYATGGGGVVLEHRAVARYMALMLAGRTSEELGGRAIVRITCQDDGAVDDIVLHAKRADEDVPSLRLAVASRRSPDLVPSDPKSQKLVTSFVREILATTSADEGVLEHRIGLAVAGEQEHARQVAELAALAEPNIDADRFFRVLRTPKRFDSRLVKRLGCLEEMVKASLSVLTKSEHDDASVRRHVLALLQRLDVVYLYLEAPDTSGWSDLANTLVSVSREGTLDGAVTLRDRLETLAGQWVPRTPDFDAALLRRHVHHLIDPDAHRRTRVWTRVASLEQLAHQQLRGEIAGSEGTSIRLGRQELADRLIAEADAERGLIVRGESGVGKSALVVDAFTRHADNNPEQAQVLCLNLEHIPAEPVDLVAFLGSPFEAVLDDLSAPRRFLIIDAADAVLRERHRAFCHLVACARKAGVAVITVVSDTAFEAVRDTLAQQLGVAVADFVVPTLDDDELDALVLRLPPLSRLLTQKRSRELLRRLVVIDLLMRGDATSPVLSDGDAFQQVWQGVVRRSRASRGGATAREIVMLQLARRELSGYTANALDFVGSLNAEALDGLIADGLLRRTDSLFGPVVPSFAHDEIRRYAVARVLLAEGDQPAQTLLGYGAPRWAMPAARLACQALFETPAPPKNVLAQTQGGFDALVAAGHGRKWADVPAEALLSCRNPRDPLTDGWAQLREDNWFGVHRLCRLVQQYRTDGVFIDTSAVEPIIALLFEQDQPWLISRKIEELIRSWLITLVLRSEPEGHVLRQRLRALLVAYCDAGDQAMRARQASAPRMDERSQRFANAFAPRTRSGRRIARPDVPHELVEPVTVKLIALLGADIATQGADLLRRIAREAPHMLAPAVESVAAPGAVVSYSYELLAQLTQAFYIDETPIGDGLFDDGVRHHEATIGRPLAAWHYGPFAVLLGRNFRAGVIIVNRLLNHAVRCRLSPELLADDDQATDLPDDVVDQIGLRVSLVPGQVGTYLGDKEVWRWFRGSGRGPNPCMSALFAVERACHELIEAGVALTTLRQAMLVECENLAMPALLLDVLTRHVEQAGELIDPFLAEPAIWQADIDRRAMQDMFSIRSEYEGPHPERKSWTLTDTAMLLALRADGDRADHLREIRRQVISKAAQQVEKAKLALGDDWTAEDQLDADQYTALVETRTSALDRDRFTFERAGNAIQVSAVPPPEAVAVLQPRRTDIARSNRLLSIHNRYFFAPRLRPGEHTPPTAQELIDDVDEVCAALENPPENSAFEPWDVACEVAATALHEHFVSRLPLPTPTLKAAARILLAVTEGARPPAELDGLYQQGEWFADRSAARGLPLLLLPQAGELLVELQDDEATVVGIVERVRTGCSRLADTAPIEARVLLAQSLDAIWDAACTSEDCYHARAFALVETMLNDCIMGHFDPAAGRRTRQPLNGPVNAALRHAQTTDIHVHHLEPAIRACAFAATSTACIQQEARALLDTLLDAQRRSLIDEPGYDHHGELSLGAARALLRLAHVGENQPLHDHLDAFAASDELLDNTIRGLAAVAEESAWARTTAQRIWPEVITQISSNPRLLIPGYPGHIRYTPLASILPHRTFETEFGRRELRHPPHEWRDLTAWRTAIEGWHTAAAGQPECVDALIGLLRTLPVSQQADIGLPWVADMVFARPAAMVPYAHTLPEWLISIRTPSEELGVMPLWQRVVDELVVSGCRKLAGYAD